MRLSSPERSSTTGPQQSWAAAQAGAAAVPTRSDQLPLELVPRAELHPAEIVGGREHATEAAISRAGVREREALPVCNVEGFRPNLQLPLLTYVELFG